MNVNFRNFFALLCASARVGFCIMLSAIPAFSAVKHGAGFCRCSVSQKTFLIKLANWILTAAISARNADWCCFVKPSGLFERCSGKLVASLLRSGKRPWRGGDRHDLSASLLVLSKPGQRRKKSLKEIRITSSPDIYDFCKEYNIPMHAFKIYPSQNFSFFLL